MDQKSIWLAVHILSFVGLEALAQDNANEGCPSKALLTSDSGTITSINYPNPYDKNLNCTWTILASSSMEIQVSFIDFNLEVGCQYDHVTVLVGNEKVKSSIGSRRYCGTTPPRNFTAPAGSNVTIEFVSDHSDQQKGFIVSWKKKSACSDVQFTCWNGTCISLSLHCDGVKDCADDSDEIECARRSGTYRECGKSNAPPDFPWDYRVIGGSQAKVGSYPWQAMLVLQRTSESEAFFCGASIIAERWILTAAHCFLAAPTSSKIAVYVGRHKLTKPGPNQVRLDVDNIILHPDYNNNDNNVLQKAIILRAKYSQLSLNINAAIAGRWISKKTCIMRFIMLHDKRSLSNPPPLSAFEMAVRTLTNACRAPNYNSDPETDVLAEKLQQVRLAIVKQSSCTSSYGAIPSNTICAGDFSLGGVDTCLGDSGGPLVCLINETAMFQVGIVSFGNGCAKPGFPGVYTKVNAFSSWINQVVKMYTPSLSLDHASPTISPPSTSSILANEETTTSTEFSTHVEVIPMTQTDISTRTTNSAENNQTTQPSTSNDSESAVPLRQVMLAFSWILFWSFRSLVYDFTGGA